jgi:hypothetical protein
MADSRSIPARATVAPAPPLKCNQWSGWQKRCCQTEHSARIRDLSAAHGGCCSLINRLCTKAVANLILPV